MTASISGKVEDATGSGIPNASVTVKSLDRGATRTVMTDESGNYTVVSLPVGAQEVRAEKTNFKSAVREGVNLAVGQEAKVNLTLEVGDTVQQVTVTEQIPVVNTSPSPVSGVVGEREVKDLPLNGRSFDQLIALNPSAINYQLKSANTITSNGNTFSVSGHRPADNLFLLNGVEYTGTSQLAVTPGGVSGDLLGIDAVREFNVLTDTYGAEYGKRAGGQVSVVTQSGTNSLHGTLFEFLRNSNLDAPAYFDQGGPPPFRRNQFGGALGGPVKKDKFFLFGNYEGFRQSLSQTYVDVVPDAASRQSASASIAPYLNFWPQPNGASLGGGAALSTNIATQHIREDFGTMKADYNLRSNDSLSASYTIDDGHSVTPQSDPLFASGLDLRLQVGSVTETRIFSPNVLNTLTAGFSRAGFNFESVPSASFPASVSFVRGLGPGGIIIGGGQTTTGAATFTSAGPNNAAGVWNRRNLFTYTDNVKVIKGVHQLSFGAWFQRLNDNEDTASRQLGQATFTSLTTFLAGTVSSFQVVPTANELGWRTLMGAVYAQDSMKLLPNLQFQIGLRYEFTTGWNEVNGRAANFITDSSGVLITAPRIGDSVYTENNAKRLLGPRAGLAWDVFGNGRTAVRAGYGTYYSMIDSLSFLLNSLPPYNGSITFSGPLQSFTPIVPNSPVPPACGPGVPSPCTTYAPQGVQANAKTPTVQEWNFSIEQQLNRNMAFRASYVGSWGYHGLLSADPNTIPAQICSNPNGCVTGGTPGTTKGAVLQGVQYIPVQSRPNPYLGAGFFWYTEGNSSYNALQLEVTRRLSRGLQFRANYTWSKNLDMNSGLTGAQAQNQAQMVLDRNDVKRDWGPSALNAEHQAVFEARYELPFGRGKQFLNNLHGVSEKLIGGWQINGIATLLSGFPFTPQVGSNRSGDGDTRNPDRPNLNASFSGPVIEGKQTQWFNPAAFTLPVPGTYGNLGRGVFTGPGLGDVDLSFFKTTSITERVNLQFRAELFNIVDRANFGAPNAIVFSGANFSPSAGLITTLATTARQAQFGLKLIF